MYICSPVLLGFDLTKQVNLFLMQHVLSSLIATSKTGGQPCSDTSTYEVCEFLC